MYSTYLKSKACWADEEGDLQTFGRERISSNSFNRSGRMKKLPEVMNRQLHLTRQQSLVAFRLMGQLSAL